MGDPPDPGTTGVTEVIGGVDTTTPNRADSKGAQHRIKHISTPPGGQDMRITPHKMHADNTGGLANKPTTVGAQRVVHAPGKSTVHHQEMIDGQTSPEVNSSIRDRK